MTTIESKPFNPNIANGFFRAGFIETWGRGIEKICEACNYYRERKHRTQREISFEYLQENTSFAPHSVDEYFVLQDKSTAFAVNGQTVIIDSEKLAKALLCLSERRREIILMRYYLQLRDKQIGALLGKPRTTVNYQKNAALKQLRTEMEKMNDEE